VLLTGTKCQICSVNSSNQSEMTFHLYLSTRAEHFMVNVEPLLCMNNSQTTRLAHKKSVTVALILGVLLSMTSPPRDSPPRPVCLFMGLLRRAAGMSAGEQ